MELAQLLDDRRVILDAAADCPKAVFRLAGDRLQSLVGLDARKMAQALADRERMGSTAVGDGLAIPHARLADLSEPQALFIRLLEPIDMDALDDYPVRLLFILLVPEEADNAHLRILSRIARVVRMPGNMSVLQQSGESADILSVFTQS